MQELLCGGGIVVPELAYLFKSALPTNYCNYAVINNDGSKTSF